MSYSQFKTIAQTKAAFNLTVLEGSRFLPPTPPHFSLPNPLGLLTGNLAPSRHLRQRKSSFGRDYLSRIG